MIILLCAWSPCNFQVGLFLFLISCLVATKIWNDGLKGLKQQTSYSSVQLKLTDVFTRQTLSRDESSLTPKAAS